MFCCWFEPSKSVITSLLLQVVGFDAAVFDLFPNACQTILLELLLGWLTSGKSKAANLLNVNLTLSSLKVFAISFAALLKT